MRLVLATNRDLEAMVRRGEFREDLYYRINVISVTQPPLRERIGDIPLLLNTTWPTSASRPARRSTGFDEQALQALRRYSWPGNVRELVNLVERSMVLSKGTVIIAAELPDAVRREELARTDLAGCGRGQPEDRPSPCPSGKSSSTRWRLTAGAVRKRPRPWASTARLCTRR